MKAIKNIALGISFVSFSLFFAACGGGDKPPQTPPNMNLVSPTGQQMIMEGVAKVDAVASGACDPYGQVVLALQVTRTPADVASVTPYITSTTASGCDDTLRNAIWLFSHATMVDGSAWINYPPSQQFLMQLFRAKLNRLAARLGISPQVLLMYPGLINLLINQNILPRITVGAPPGVAAGIPGYMNLPPGAYPPPPGYPPSPYGPPPGTTMPQPPAPLVF